ncbi:secretion protein [Pseudoalteromonas sp. NEC-BIFX-2020_015]|uniref:basic secretory protein-like protein n=1 Tax=Pseudoalteromonas sp. NEC-BIFX-2020_015 TaxID=2729544 RepID=UPI0014614DE2|nr:basic secretory protein-like protein [Pseudoalteromonas sp. NEC-BIFX-2020_015]NMR27326.1 secretion protein [Pseudoalteromonas sp. NEC-BIFX-2020_015]
MASFTKKSLSASTLITLLLSANVMAKTPVSEQLKPVQFNADIQWQQFYLPVVTLTNTSSEQLSQWSDLTTELVQQVSYNVARLLYKYQANAPALPTLAISLEDMDGVAFKEGDFSGAKIHISAQYLKKYQADHGKRAMADELIGVLYHEIAHAYQLDDANYKNIGPLIEGIADVVRIKAGYVDMSQRKIGGNYNDGYKTTAFFIHWLEKNKHHDLLIKLNAQLDPNDGKTWQWQNFESNLNINLVREWNNYQTLL